MLMQAHRPPCCNSNKEACKDLKLMCPRTPAACHASETRFVASAAASSTAVVERGTGVEPANKVSTSPQGVFLKRYECMQVLNRIADSCMAAAPDGGSVPGSTGSQWDQQEASGEIGMVSQVFEALYDELEEVFYSKRGYVIPKRETVQVEATGGSPTYGEITGVGIVGFLQRVPLQPDDVFVDLGSGIGRLVLQVACSIRLRRCVGLELSASRHEQACWVAERLAELGTEAGIVTAGADDVDGSITADAGDSADSRAAPFSSAAAAPGVAGLLLSPVELRCEDLMRADLADGSAFFLCSTAFSATACRAVTERLARHPPFRMLVTSRALPFPGPLKLLGHFRCSYSWTAAGTAYVYIRSLKEAPAGLLAAFLAAEAPPLHEGDGVTEDDEGDKSGVPAKAGMPGGSRGGVAWLPSLSTLSVVSADLLV